MNQLSTGRARQGVGLLIKYLIVAIVVVTIITSSIIGAIGLQRRQSVSLEVDNLYEIAEIQIASQYNSILGDALSIEAITRSYLEEEILHGNLLKMHMEQMYDNYIANTGKYAAITYVQSNGFKVYSGDPKDTEVSEFMLNTYEDSENNEVLYAYMSQFYHSNEVKEVTFTVIIPMQNSAGEVLGYIILEPYLRVVVKEIERALANANIQYELLAIEGGDAVYVYSDIDKARGTEFMKFSDVKGSQINEQLVLNTEGSGSFSSKDGESFYNTFEMPISNYHGEKHTYIVPGTYVYMLTLPTAYYGELTQLDRTTTILLAVAVAVVALVIALLMYVAQNNRRKLTAKTTKMAQVDTLTGLLNRAYFTELFEDMVEEDPEAKYAILFMDLDGFKDINDTYGHNMGDKVLRVVSNRLVMAARREDLVSRFGGDEFAMLINYSSIDQIRYFANKVVRAVDETMVIEDNEYQVGVSVGVAIYPDHARSVDDLYKVADNAMYKVKYSTKNAYYISKGDDKIL